jgi:tetratricopeptide (TPR) repeat protein
MTSIEQLEALHRQAEQLVERAEAIAATPHLERRRGVLKEVGQQGDKLLQVLEEAAIRAERALQRAALIQEGDPEELLARLDLVREAVRSLQGRVGFVKGTQARREGRQQAGRAALERASLLTEGEMQVDAYKQLAELHMKGEKRTHYHAARGIYSLLPHARQDLRKAEAELTEALSLDASNLLAAYGRGLLLEATGEHAAAQQAFLGVLARAKGSHDPVAEQACEWLRRRLQRCTTPDELQALSLGLLQRAPAYGSMRPILLLEAYHHPAMDTASRRRLRLVLAEPTVAFVRPPERIDDANDRNLRLWQAARLRLMHELLGEDSLEAACERVEQDDLSKLENLPIGTTQPAIVARLLSDLWSIRARLNLDGELHFESLADRMAAYVVASDHDVRWLATAVEANASVDASYPQDLELLLEKLTRMWVAVSDDPMDAESLLTLIPSEELQEKLAGTLGSLFEELARQGRVWEELEYCDRLELILESVSRGQQLTEFARGELRGNLFERLLRLGDPRILLHARVELARLYVNQHRYDQAIEHARAAAEMDRKNAEAIYWLGIIYMRSGKRLLGLDELRQAAERFGHPAANAALGEDCARDDQPHFSSLYFIKAVEHSLKRPSTLTPEDLKQVRQWLHRALVENQNVKDFPIIVDKKLPRRERKAKKKELEELNTTRREDQRVRGERILELERRLKEIRVLFERDSGRRPPSRR